MDLNGDGRTDILSGSYSRTGAEFMAGLFFVLERQEDGSFSEPAALEGTDGKPLILGVHDAAGDENIQRICTRAWAVDLTGDGALDLVSGNFGGTFALFEGAEGGGFEPESRPLTDAEGTPLKVPFHSDPTFADMDGDGDQDLISGATDAAVYMFPNVSEDGGVAFGQRLTLVERPTSSGDHGSLGMPIGTDSITAPTHASRVAVADLDGDGKLDLLVGDQFQYGIPGEGLALEEVERRMEAWQAEMAEISRDMPRIEDWENMTEEESDAMDAHFERQQAHMQKRDSFLEIRSTGTVWLYLAQ